jgi:diaminopropionate ammonia-lyase
MEIFLNPYRNSDLRIDLPAHILMPSVDAAKPLALLQRCPAAAVTPLVDAPDLAATLGVSSVSVKDERGRMGLGSFKALGAAYVIASDAAAVGGDLRNALAGRTYVTSSAGNHGLSVAGGAAAFGANAVIYLSASVPESFAKRLRKMGAEVVRAGAIYEESMVAAVQAAKENGWSLLSDTSWDEYYEVPHVLMEGYCVLMAEVFDQIADVPTHVFLQAGVGGLAGSAAAMIRDRWGCGVQVIVVEPDFAPALMASAKAGRAVVAEGPVSDMGRLDCKEPSMIALKGLCRDADVFVSISEAEAFAAMPVLEAAGLAASTSGGAGLAAMLAGYNLPQDARVLAILSEGVA